MPCSTWPSVQRWCFWTCRSSSGPADRRLRLPGRDLDLDPARHRRARQHERPVLVDGGAHPCSLLDEDGAAALLRGAEESVAIAEQLGCSRVVVFGTELGPAGVPLRPVHEIIGPMWLTAHRTLCRLAELGERAGVTFCLEN